MFIRLLHLLVSKERFLRSKIRFIFFKKDKSYLKIKSLKNTCKTKRCFILGNGPSLNINDLNLLINEDCFASNRIYDLYDKTIWRPKYYCIQDDKVIKAIKSNLKLAVKNTEKAFLIYNYKHLYKDDILKDERVNLFFQPYISTWRKNNKLDEGCVPFSNDISKGIFNGGSIIYPMIQIAVYMGYKEIYLLGVDHNYILNSKGLVDSKLSYCKGIKAIDMKKQYKPALELCEFAFREAKKYCENNNIKIMNATRGGKLEVFDRIDLDLLLKNKSKS